MILFAPALRRRRRRSGAGAWPVNSPAVPAPLAAGVGRASRRMRERNPSPYARPDRARCCKRNPDFVEEKEKLYYSDIAEQLSIDLSLIIKACELLQKRGLIEGAINVTPRAKRSRR